ncbi:phosphate ABC transporter substrate-binding protein [Nitratidesulfovibrio liaohensis]|uniref:phosphate ABC transporter substrate-binding protein n=1 Tax=Nitratidesulfovibrio liaohensis TaxID=2604158 RepID=UPI0014212C8D|nr:phosphate ABC transporter substrate-binding protein [Nitratidesulfovibrio liaohensis]NHZ46326.1 phosphate ABC transporter substrate-binding protein [Nitratidesulfovibrio liaohensis]
MRRLRAVLSLVMILALCLAAASAGAAPLDAFAPQSGITGSLDIAGGTAHIPVMKEAAKRIMTVNPALRISVAGGGSGVGVQQVGEGLVAIGNTGRPLTEAEVQKYGLVSFPFAIDGVAVVVSPANPVTGLTGKQVADIFAGTVTNWKDVGGKDAPITLYTREDGSGTREVFVEKALKKGPQAATANVVNSNGAMKTAIAQDPNSIGYVGIGHLGDSIKGLHFDGMVPTQDNAASGAYSVTRKLYMNTRGAPQGLAKAFIDYIFSPEGQEITKASGYIPLDR